MSNACPGWQETRWLKCPSQLPGVAECLDNTRALYMKKTTYIYILVCSKYP